MYAPHERSDHAPTIPFSVPSGGPWMLPTVPGEPLLHSSVHRVSSTQTMVPAAFPSKPCHHGFAASSSMIRLNRIYTVGEGILILFSLSV